MSAEDAGSIVSQIRFDLTQLETDALQAQKKMDRFAHQFGQKGRQAGAAYIEGFGHAQGYLNRRLNQMVSSMQGISPKMGAAGAKIAAAFSKPIFAVIPVLTMAFRTMLPFIGAITAAVTFLVKGIQRAVNAHRKNAEIMQLSATTSENLTNITNTLTASQNANSVETERMAIRMSEAYRKTRRSSEEIRAEIEQIALEARHLGGSFTRAGREASRAADSLWKTLRETSKLEREAAESVIELNKEVNQSIANMNHQLGIRDKALQTNSITALEGINQEIRARERLRDSLLQSLAAYSSLADFNAEAKERAAELEQTIAAINGRISELSGNAEAETLFERSVQIAEEYRMQLRLIQSAHAVGNITEAQMNRDRHSAAERHITDLIRQREAYERIHGAQSEQIRNIDATIGRMQSYRAEIEALIATYEDLEAIRNEGEIRQQSINEARDAAQIRHDQAIARAERERLAGLITREQEEERQFQATRRRYEELAAVMERFRISRTLNNVDTSATLREEATALSELMNLENERRAAFSQEQFYEHRLSISEELTRQEINRLNTQADLAESDEERNRLLDEAIRLENILIRAQRQRAWNDIEYSEWFKLARREEQNELRQLFNMATEGMMRVRKEAEREPEKTFWERIFGSDTYGYLMQVGSSAASAFSDISSTILEISRRHAQRQIQIIQDSLKEMLDIIDQAREAQLIAAGFVVNNSIESLEAELAHAKKTGDQRLIFIAHSRLKEQQINDKFDEQAKEEKRKAANEQAQLEYEVAMQQHRTKLINAANFGLMAFLQALASAPPPWNFVLAGISKGAAVAQIALLAANPPDPPPKFASGGIVPGNSFIGDRMTVMANSDEMFLTKQQQLNLFNAIRDNQLGNTETGPINLTLVLDGKTIAKNTIDRVNRREYLIDMRSVK